MKNHSVQHIAIIPDGNRRWAKQKGVSSFIGHKKGAELAIKLARKIRKMGVSTLTFWAFSTENWNRSQDEIKYLIMLGEGFFDKISDEAIKERIRVTHIGRKDRLPKSLLDKIALIEEKTKGFTEYYLNIALDYGGRDEIVRAVQRLEKDRANVVALDEESFKQYLDTGDQPHPYPDIVIRTSGEFRTSGFLPWQTAYAEFFFVDKYFPDLSEADIDSVVANFSNRERRFGK